MPERWSSPRRILTTLCVGTGLLVLAQCASPIPMGVDSKANVLAGLSEVLVRSVTFSPTSSSTGFIPSGTSVTVTVAIINPKNLDVRYTLSSNLPAGSFTVAPPPVPTATTSTSLSFSFTLASGAEHHDVQFTLGKSVPSTGKVFPSDTLLVHCDSPPNPVANLIAGSDTTTLNGFLAFTLPVAASDDDLSSLDISFQDVSLSPPGPSTSATVGVNDPTLLSVTPYAPDPLVLVVSTTKRYFKPTLTAGHAYAFLLTLSDAAGQKAATQTIGGAGVQYTLSYDLNGGTGTVPPTTTYTYYDSATLPAAPTRTGYTFHGWNTAIGGTGTPITANFNMTLGNITLYAQWTAISVTGISALPATATLGTVGSTLALSAAAVPVTALNPLVNWSSDTLGVAAVDASGLVTAGGLGTATITATTADGGYFTQCVVTVTGQSNLTVQFSLGLQQTLSFTSPTATVGAGSTLTITATGALATLGTSWSWDVDGVPDGSSTTSSYSFSKLVPRLYIVNVVVTYQGVLYSGACQVTVTQ